MHLLSSVESEKHQLSCWSSVERECTHFIKLVIDKNRVQNNVSRSECISYFDNLLCGKQSKGSQIRFTCL